MSNISAETLEKKKKLEMLKAKQAAREEKIKKDKEDITIGGPGAPKTDLNQLVDDLLNSNVEAPKYHVESGPRAHSASPGRPRPKLELASFLAEYNILSKDRPETYDHAIQTETLGGPEPAVKKRSISMDEEDALPTKNRAKTVLKAPEQVDQTKQVNTTQAAPTQVQPKDVDPEEAKNLMKSKPFTDFFTKSTKLIEKALNQQVGLLEDIIAGEDGRIEENRGEILRSHVKLYDKHHSHNRVITDLNWSPHIPDLLLASYSPNEEGTINDPVGLVLLWSLGLKTRPEFTLISPSFVTSATFNPFLNNIVVGGLYSGQILVWDLRAKAAPVQRTSITQNGHTNPIYSIAVVGSQNAHNFVSVSNDGRLCVWNTAMLTNPQKTIDLETKSSDSTKAQNINISCMAFPESDANNFYVGAEDGNLYLSQIHSNQAKNKLLLESFTGHDAPVSGVSIYPPQVEATRNLNGLVLTSSFDWTVKLWNPRLPGEAVATFETAQDYVYDVQWHPTLPGVFNSVDGEGFVDVWSLTEDLEAPLVHTKAVSNAINKGRFNRDGSKYAVGDSSGNLTVYDFAKELINPSQEKIDAFDAFVNKPKTRRPEKYE